MKKTNALLCSSLATATVLLALTPSAHATTVGQTTTAAPIAANVQQTPPVTLVRLAQHGYLAQQGIPSGGDLVFAAQAGQITPEALVQAGIKAGQVSPETLQDGGYLNVVANQLNDLVIFSVSE